MSNSLWPPISSLTPSRGLRDMLYDAAGDIDAQTNGDLQLYIDTLGVSAAIDKVRHNCYLRVPKTGYTHLLFRVTSPVPGPWPADATTPEGDTFPSIQNKNQLRDAIQRILQRDRTKEIVLYLLSTVR
jgi:hypothetical protein